MIDLKHACKGTCSGYDSGFDDGYKQGVICHQELNRSLAKQIVTHETQIRSLRLGCRAEIKKLQEKLDIAVEALEKVKNKPFIKVSNKFSLLILASLVNEIRDISRKALEKIKGEK